MKYPGHRNRKKPEPVSSTSRRGARVEYHDKYPPRLSASDQAGRKMSAPRPYETHPFHPPALFTPYVTIDFCIYTKMFQLFIPCGINIGPLERCTFVIHACALPVLKSFCPLRGTWWYEIERKIAFKTRHEFIAIMCWCSQ